MYAPSSPDERFILVRTAIAEKLPGLADLPYQVEIQIGGKDFVLVPRRLRDNLSARIAKVTGPVKLSDVPRRLDAHAIDGGDEIAISHRVRGLLQLPQVLAQAGHGGGRIEHDLGAVE